MVSSSSAIFSSVEKRRRRLFDDPTLCVSPWEIPDLSVSEPERAVLEMLWGVPQHQGQEEAFHLMESLFGLRASRMQALLESCHSVKAVRFFLHYAERAALPVLDDLDLTRVNMGSATPYVRRHASGTIKI
ncbi:MAG TPA: type IV toxin-antitoxin system AbiEi family antitoxin domain-containing protein [Hyphomicrobiales bacterium]|nr:type IV toxin-antitoxin system AbiEi family antitoxin domain-containing protein [Hyphomicrobiales bacterium]